LFLRISGLLEPIPTTGMMSFMRVDQSNINTGIDNSHNLSALLFNKFHPTFGRYPGIGNLLRQQFHFGHRIVKFILA